MKSTCKGITLIGLEPVTAPVTGKLSGRHVYGMYAGNARGQIIRLEERNFCDGPFLVYELKEVPPYRFKLLIQILRLKERKVLVTKARTQARYAGL